MKYLSSSALLCHSCGSDITEKNVLSFLQTPVLHKSTCIWWCQEFHEVIRSSECKTVKIICIWFQCSSVFLEDVYGALITHLSEMLDSLFHSGSLVLCVSLKFRGDKIEEETAKSFISVDDIWEVLNYNNSDVCWLNTFLMELVLTVSFTGSWEK